MLERRRRLMTATVGFALAPPRELELRLLHRWLDTWAGIGLIVHGMARQGYDAQQYDGPADPDRPHNLYEPLPGDHGAHGDFDNRSSPQSIELWLSQHRRWLLLGGAILAGWFLAPRCHRHSQDRTGGQLVVKNCL